MGWFRDLYELNNKAFVGVTALVLLFFPLDWVDLFATLSVSLFVGIGNFLFGGLLVVINFILGGLTGILNGILNAIASALNLLIPFGDPFPPSSLTYSTIPFNTMVSPTVNMFIDGQTLLGYILGWAGFGFPW